MGGIGSGRHKGFGEKSSTADYCSVDVRRWSREYLLNPGKTFRWAWSTDGETVASIQVRVGNGRVILMYRHKEFGGDWVDESQSIALDWTPCHYGDHRPWFRCPQCGRRVALLYCGSTFKCRHCLRLAYPCQGEADYERAARRADKIRKRLGWEPGILNLSGDKPKGMHWSTYERLTTEHDALVGRALAGLGGQLIYK